jgi:GcrA cell cycle regulator
MQGAGPGSLEMKNASNDERKATLRGRPKHPRLNISTHHEVAAFPRPKSHAEAIPIYDGRGCTLLELSQMRCRWPISNPGVKDFCFCGNEPVKGLPYCLGHARIAYSRSVASVGSAAARVRDQTTAARSR